MYIAKADKRSVCPTYHPLFPILATLLVISSTPVMSSNRGGCLSQCLIIIGYGPTLHDILTIEPPWKRLFKYIDYFYKNSGNTTKIPKLRDPKYDKRSLLFYATRPSPVP